MRHLKIFLRKVYCLPPCLKSDHPESAAKLIFSWKEYLRICCLFALNVAPHLFVRHFSEYLCLFEGHKITMYIYYFARLLTHYFDRFLFPPFLWFLTQSPIPQARESPGRRNLPHTEAPRLDALSPMPGNTLFGSQPSGGQASGTYWWRLQGRFLAAFTGPSVLPQHGGAPSLRTSPR